MAQTVQQRSVKSDPLDLTSRYFRIEVRDAAGKIAWLVRCMPEVQARSYARSTNRRTRTTGFRAKAVEIDLPALPSLLVKSVVKGGAE